MLSIPAGIIVSDSAVWGDNNAVVGKWGETGKVIFLHFKQTENNTFCLKSNTLIIWLS